MLAEVKCRDQGHREEMMQTQVPGHSLHFNDTELEANSAVDDTVNQPLPGGVSLSGALHISGA